jgi:hypothetical protein
MYVASGLQTRRRIRGRPTDCWCATARLSSVRSVGSSDPTTDSRSPDGLLVCDSEAVISAKSRRIRRGLSSMLFVHFASSWLGPSHVPSASSRSKSLADFRAGLKTRPYVRLRPPRRCVRPPSASPPGHRRGEPFAAGASFAGRTVNTGLPQISRNVLGWWVGSSNALCRLGVPSLP